MATVKPTWGEISEAPPSMTADDLPRLPDDGYRYELYEGMLVREICAPAHGAMCQRVGGELGIWARTTGFPNSIVQNTLFDLPVPGATRRTVLAPDVAILRPGASLTWRVPHESPLLAAEVVSGSQTLAEHALKAETYRQAGVEEVWIVDYHTRSIQVWTAQAMTTLDDTQTLTTPLLPGFSTSVRFPLDG